ncbi:helix-turn-helix domain-containing protein [Paraflavitalea sp. CAU 1676]|uniref:winged helix-turn-helix transcriptional regulator n=1 Tax=Paraflavitalea sp. CAU 1676 TaxID=3032598 RepID=UPI0023DA4ECE|nr:helix-turn-helix domain-containing protein [Paraflavitalea sp. CAU 1676]MDF2193781.1 helix-turn-helix domain-containing protein [Paraflavitalea sp. CAU 1676]
MYERKIKEDLDCGIVVAMKVFGSKWKPCIIDAIGRGIKRPSELHRAITSTSARVIDMQLSELMAHGIVTRKIHAGFPLFVEYSLTAVGETILPILEQLNTWGLNNKHILDTPEENGATGEDAFLSNKRTPVSSIC